jgi:hypothetical protein
LPAELVTLVEKAAWPASVSLIEIEPEALRLPLPLTAVSSVTVPTVGVPMMAASLTPLIVKDTTFVVPSALAIVKVSTLVLPAPSDWVAALATV